jgi:hypothetical protein
VTYEAGSISSLTAATEEQKQKTSLKRKREDQLVEYIDPGLALTSGFCTAWVRAGRYNESRYMLSAASASQSTTHTPSSAGVEISQTHCEKNHASLSLSPLVMHTTGSSACRCSIGRLDGWMDCLLLCAQLRVSFFAVGADLGESMCKTPS